MTDGADDGGDPAPFGWDEGSDDDTRERDDAERDAGERDGEGRETETRDDAEDSDPFERIGEGSGPRRGDPFDALADADDGANGDADRDAASGAENDAPSNAGGGEPTTVEDPFADPARDGLPAGDDGDAHDAVDDSVTPFDESSGDPFTEFDEPATDPFGEGGGPFEGATGAVGDDDGVWERMESSGGEAEAIPGKRYVDVNKHSYCETCEHFSEPPEVACSHEGTEILEFVDMETVRVVDCPVVEERKALEDRD